MYRKRVINPDVTWTAVFLFILIKSRSFVRVYTWASHPRRSRLRFFYIFIKTDIIATESLLLLLLLLMLLQLFCNSVTNKELRNCSSSHSCSHTLYLCFTILFFRVEYPIDRMLFNSTELFINVIPLSGQTDRQEIGNI